MGHFSDQVHITVDSFTLNVIHSELKISQKMADHHHFSFIWHYAAAVVIDPVDQAKALRKYLGREVIFTFLVNGVRVMAKGIIDELLSVDKNGSPDGIYVRGKSHTVFLDDMKKSRIYLEHALRDIVPKIFAEGPSDFYQRDAIAPTHQKEFKYLAQYNETSFEFLKRIAARYGQWFYFDGMRMQFGQLKTSKVKLVNNSSLENFKIQINLSSHKTAIGGYDSDSAANIRNSAAKTSKGSADSFSNVVRYSQGTITLPDLTDGAHTSNALDKEEIDEMIRLQTAGTDANSVFYSGTSYFPIGLGQVFTITNGTVEHELIAIEITHLSKLHGNYTCEFKAIPADVSAPHYTDVEAFAKAETQPATVIDNNDPEGMGRIRVKFNWGNGINKSDWIRMIQPHSGADKGFYFIPEIDEEVLVGFEGANIQRPFVMGTEYNGQNKSGYATENNDLKVIQTRSGNRIISDDATGDVTIESQKGQTIAVIHGDGNIRFKAPKNIEFEAGEDFIVNAGRDVKIEATRDIAQTADRDINILAAGNINEAGDNKTENITDAYTRSSHESKQFAEEVQIFSTKENMLLESSQKTVEINSAEKTNFF